MSLQADLRALIGPTFGPTGWRLVDQDEVNTFAGIAGDHQWIHVDVERAERESPFGGTIAHGSLSLALIDGFRDELMPVGDGDRRWGVNYGFDRVRFPAPLKVGTRVRATLEVVDVEDAGDGWWQVRQRFAIESEDGGKPVCVADSLIRVREA